jgi:hypothetical protein
MEPFDTRLPTVQARLENWWEYGDQEHPCVLYTSSSPSPLPIPDTDDLRAWWTDVDFIVERQMRQLDAQVFYGQSVPCHYVNLGSSAMAGILGARMEYLDKRTVWAHPTLTSIEQIMDVDVDRDGLYYRVLRETTERSVALAQDHHYVSHFALCGMTDTCAALYGTENMLVDMATRPEPIALAMEHLKRIWVQVFSEFQSILDQSGNRGSIGWAGIWAPGSTFPIQEDRSYMISGEMFRQYCLPHVVDMVDAMDYPFYHLDGEPALAHLEYLLEIPALRVIQWVPGWGQERLDQWYEVIRRILEAGKSVQVFGRVGEVDDLLENVGTRGVLIGITGSDLEEVEPLLERFGYL